MPIQLASLSNEVQEIISNKPSWIVRNGILLLLLIMMALLGVCYFIRYPDIVTANAKLTSINAPKPVVANIGGKLARLWVKENDVVKAGEALGYIESNASHKAVLQLEKYLQAISYLLEANQTEKLQSVFNKNDGLFLGASLGELQQPYQIFVQAWLTFKNYLKNGLYLHKKELLLTDFEFLHQLNTILNEQKELQLQDVGLSQETFTANEALKNQKIISSYEYRTEKSKLINKQLSLPQIKASIISNASMQNEKQKEILELENQIAQHKLIFKQEINTLQSLIREWETKYVLKAPIDGKISFAIFFQENQQVTLSQTICYISPDSSIYYADMTIPQANFGKIKIGQSVLLKFNAYPYQEFGAVKGFVEFINRIPTDSGYVAKITLPSGLASNYKKNIQFRDGLIAKGEIITKDIRLLSRFYYSIFGGNNIY